MNFRHYRERFAAIFRAGNCIFEAFVRTGILLCLLAMPASAFAACSKNEDNRLANFDGSIGETYRIRMSLVFSGERINGLYFYASQLRDISLRGRIENGTDILLDELDAQGNITAHFAGRFVERDPHGGFGGGRLECEVIVGTWNKQGDSRQLPVYLSMESSTPGSLTHRYSLAGVEDDALIHRRVSRFRDAVRRGDKKGVAAQLAYPLNVRLGGKKKSLRGPAGLIEFYDEIFSVRYREAIANALPRNMFVGSEGIMLGRGEVWFGPDGRVIALNNY